MMRSVHTMTTRQNTTAVWLLKETVHLLFKILLLPEPFFGCCSDSCVHRTCLLQTPTVKFFSPCEAVDGTDGGQISTLICIQNPGLADAALCEMYLNAAVNTSVSISVCLLLHAA